MDYLDEPTVITEVPKSGRGRRRIAVRAREQEEMQLVTAWL